MNLPSVQSLLKKYRIRPKKRLGQHYLSAQPTMLKIVEALQATKGDVVLEIGCGLGLMTAMLAERARHVYAVDADMDSLQIACNEFGGDGGSLLRWSNKQRFALRGLCAVLEDSHHRRESNITWIHGDILKQEITSYARGGKLLVIGNIPYNISTPIFFHLLDNRQHITRAVLMVQKEVADRVVAKPGGKEYGALSVMMQAYARCKKLFNVSRTNFIPPPAVMSSVVQLDFSGSNCGRRGPAESSSRAPLHRRRRLRGKARRSQDPLRMVVQAAFQKRRKTLRNALLGSTLAVSADRLDRILDELAIDPRRRPETLSVDDFRALADAIGRFS